MYSPSMVAVGYLLFGEMLGTGELLGGVLVVTGVAVGMRKTEDVKSPVSYTHLTLPTIE